MYTLEQLLSYSLFPQNFTTLLKKLSRKVLKKPQLNPSNFLFLNMNEIILIFPYISFIDDYSQIVPF